jgi:hypothetical protein
MKSLQDFFSKFTRISESSLYLKDYFDFLDITSKSKNKETVSMPAKITIGFEFKNVFFAYPESDNQILKDITFKINAASIRSRKPVRDANITKYFFLNMTGGLFLTGKITKLDKEKKRLYFDITFNRVTQSLIFDIKVTKTKWSASGVIDVLKFDMIKGLSALNQACFKKHQGKTWSDVKVDLIIWYSEDCP